MSKIKVFCFGFGQVAKYFVKKIIKVVIVIIKRVIKTIYANTFNFDSLKEYLSSKVSSFKTTSL